MPRFEGNILMHNWYGSAQEDDVAELMPNKNPAKPQPWVLVADCIDATYRKYYYEKPTAEEAFEGFLRWQNAY